LIRIESIPAARAWSASVRQAGEVLGFVPTMGALHEGHLSLLRRARAECPRTVVSIFVNPLQFVAGEDFERYPRDLEGDARLLDREGADALFTTTPREMYPPGFSTTVEAGPLGARLEGAHRPGHFRGVLTVVLKLFEILRPDRAYFGEKDAQQLALVRRMVRDLDVAVEVVACPLVRDADGVALSSRNAYLAPAERERARCLVQALRAARAAWAGGERDPQRLAARMREVVATTPGASLDYAEVVDPDTLEAAPGGADRALALLAVRIGSTRFLDNSRLDRTET
jgi:pantoate--beta-alanine ligase